MTFLDLESPMHQNDLDVTLSLAGVNLDKKQNLCKAKCKDGSKCLNKGKYASFCRHHKLYKRDDKSKSGGLQ
ncbi:MAG: hypothetical protein Q8L34_06170 [Candidatus Woesearchaeota archaeon]|nr:hypothetical protein [Candidatus Woesearchaeota archaeon]